MRTFLVLQTTASKINYLDGTFCGVFKQNILHTISTAMRWDKGSQYLWLQITVNDAVMPHQR
jgi:hypothetical protein